MRTLAVFLFLSTVSIAVADETIRITGQTTATPSLPGVAGVRNIEVFHAVAGGWTYNHHVDMGALKGRLYLA